MIKLDNCCPTCHNDDVIKIEKVLPSPSMSNGVLIRFKCKKCKEEYETEYAIGNHTRKE